MNDEDDFIEIIPVGDGNKDVEQALDSAKKADLDYVFIIGSSENAFYFGSSESDSDKAVWYINKFMEWIGDQD